MSQKTLKVRLDPSKNPPVQVDPIVLGRRKMFWKPEDNPRNFDFVDIDFSSPGAPNPFTKKPIKPDKVSASNDTKLQGDFEYTITVRDENGQEYTSTAVQAPSSGGKPVIRN